MVFNHIFLIYLIKPKIVQSAEESLKPTPEYIKRLPDTDFYILGPGDKLKIEVKEDITPELNIIFRVDGQGIANLKRLKRVYVEGLTVAELREILNEEYSAYVKNPDVQLVILEYRPVKVYVDGEVVEPGMYTLPGQNTLGLNAENSESDSFSNTENSIIGTEINSKTIPSGRDTMSEPINVDNNNNVFFPSLIDVLRKTGGVTTFANLEQIKVTRINSISNGGGKIATEINLMDTLNLVDGSQNIRILDGDTILIKKTNKPVFELISKAIKSNINPRFIKVFLSGRVENAGPVTVSKTSSLVEAIQIAGGTKVLKGKVRFIRYNNDGSVDKRLFAYRKNAERGSYNNPILRNGDVINIGRSNVNVFSEVIGEITSPLQGIVSAYAFIKIFEE